jgi:hypothetical protein
VTDEDEKEAIEEYFKKIQEAYEVRHGAGPPSPCPSQPPPGAAAGPRRPC